MLEGKLSTQLGVVFFIAIALVVSLMSWKQYENLSKELPLQVESEVKQHAEIIAEAVANNVLYKKSYPLWLQMKKTLDRFQNEPLLHMYAFAVVDEDNLVLEHSDTRKFPLLTPLELSEAKLNWSGHLVKIVTSALHPTR